MLPLSLRREIQGRNNIRIKTDLTNWPPSRLILIIWWFSKNKNISKDQDENRHFAGNPKCCVTCPCWNSRWLVCGYGRLQEWHEWIKATCPNGVLYWEANDLRLDAIQELRQPWRQVHCVRWRTAVRAGWWRAERCDIGTQYHVACRWRSTSKQNDQDEKQGNEDV